MKPKKIITFALLAFVVISIGYLVLDNTSKSPAQVMVPSAAPSETGQSFNGPKAVSPGATPATTPLDESEIKDKVIALYFHGTMRCDTCIAIEDLTREALNSGFSEKLQTGKLEMQSINVDEDEYGHFVEDYQLTTRTVVIARFVNGEQQEWKRLDDVWQLVLAGDRDKFIEYVQEETGALLAKAS